MINRTNLFTSRLLVLLLTAFMVMVLANEALAIPPPELVRIGSVFVQVLPSCWSSSRPPDFHSQAPHQLIRNRAALAKTSYLPHHSSPAS